MKKMRYKGWKNCYRLDNGIVELILTTDIGPRVIRFGFVEEENEFKEYEDQVGRTGGKQWRLYGGHRFWHGPEARPRTYFPDNQPVALEKHRTFVRIVQKTESTTGIQKELDIRLSSRTPHVQITHRLRNNNLWNVELAPWALSVMAQGGKAILPLPPRGSHEKELLPTNSLTLWAYTDMSDRRWTWGNKYIMLQQDPKNRKPQKVGARVPDGWAAYARNGHLFVKRYHHVAGATYPDFGCSVETFTNEDMLEVETLGPMCCLEPNATVEHIEEWFLYRGVPFPMHDRDVDKNVLPKIRASRMASCPNRKS